ncbi:TolC family protein [Spirulina sp. 06S082]|uniref:TolC family protein n=1 Tax=Spirulina sp. 06S082 TaxID=3110248 RepID=UPI002B1F9274|nr:TolC family protein [Spirulina sp. 06S082]MEA5470635.1 TolC family protein [Spirulina sp. 06S082]
MTRKPKFPRSSFRSLLVIVLRNGSSTLFAVLGTLAALAIASGNTHQSVAGEEDKGNLLTSFFKASTPAKDSLSEIPTLEPIPDLDDPKVISPSSQSSQKEEKTKKLENRAPSFQLFQLPDRNSLRPSSRKSSRENTRASREETRRSRESSSPQKPSTPQTIPATNSEQKPTQTTARLTSDAANIPFTLEDVVHLTVANNTEIKNAYLARIVQQAELASAQAEFRPKVEPILAGRTNGAGTNWAISDSQSRIELGAGISLLMPTGGQLQLSWLSQLRSLSNTQTNGDSLRQRVNLRLTQPLLRDAGVAIAKSDLDIARLRENINVLNLQNTLIEEITTSIKSYRTLLTQQEQVKNTRAALEIAKKQLQRQQALVEAGREAEFRLLRSQKTVTDFQGQLLEAENAVKSSRLALLNQLGIDRDLKIIATENVRQETEKLLELDPEKIREATFANQPNYLAELLQIQVSELSVLQANNDRRWNLDLETEFDEALTRQANFSAGIVLRRNLGNRFQDEANFKRAEITLLQSQNNLTQLEETIETEISDRLRDIEVKFQQIQLAQEEVKLAEGELAAQEALVKAGKSDNFQLQEAQQDLLNARNIEISRRVEYLNTLTDLQQTRGTTLEDWQIILETRSHNQ